MDIETIWYEYSPFVYAVAGILSVSNYGSYLSVVFGTLLIAASLTILRMRWVYRKKQAEKIHRDKREERVARRKRTRQVDPVDDQRF